MILVNSMLSITCAKLLFQIVTKCFTQTRFLRRKSYDPLRRSSTFHTWAIHKCFRVTDVNCAWSALFLTFHHASHQAVICFASIKGILNKVSSCIRCQFTGVTSSLSLKIMMLVSQKGVLYGWVGEMDKIIFMVIVTYNCDIDISHDIVLFLENHLINCSWFK